MIFSFHFIYQEKAMFIISLSNIYYKLNVWQYAWIQNGCPGFCTPQPVVSKIRDTHSTCGTGCQACKKKEKRQRQSSVGPVHELPYHSWDNRTDKLSLKLSNCLARVVPGLDKVFASVFTDSYGKGRSLLKCQVEVALQAPCAGLGLT